MTVDFAALMERLAAHQLQVVAPAIADPKIARAAGVTGMLLQQAARDFDEAPGRYRSRAAEMERLISSYAGHSGEQARFQALLDAPVDSDRLSGLQARDCALQAALIEVAGAIEGQTTAWAAMLRHEIRAAYLRWTA